MLVSWTMCVISPCLAVFLLVLWTIVFYLVLDSRATGVVAERTCHPRLGGGGHEVSGGGERSNDGCGGMKDYVYKIPGSSPRMTWKGLWMTVRGKPGRKLSSTGMMGLLKGKNPGSSPRMTWKGLWMTKRSRSRMT